MDKTLTPAANSACEMIRQPVMTFDRKKQLVEEAQQLASKLQGTLEPHEFCFFRQAVEMFLDRY